MTTSFIGQVGDVTNHKQDFEKLHVCFLRFLPLSLGSVGGGRGEGQGAEGGVN